MSFWKIVCLMVLIGCGWKAFSAPSTNAPAASPLAWDPPNAVYNAKPGEVSAKFTFKVRNNSSSQVTIDDVKTSCGCTIAQFPSKPWQLAPGETNHMDVLVDLRGKYGKIFKQIIVVSSNAPATLTVVVDIPNPGTNAMSTQQADRMWGQQLAAMDHQAVFKKDCVKCHLEPAFGKFDKNLYAVACGICHEAKHRATMVPDLHALKTPIEPDYWRHWVTYGKPGTLMPGFASTLGGPLDEDQIKSLTNYLAKAFPRPLKQKEQTANAH